MPTTGTSYKCKKCGDEIPANTNKNLTTCKCGALAVDGCADYVRVIGDKEDWMQWEAAGAEDVAKHVPPLTDAEKAHYQNLKDLHKTPLARGFAYLPNPLPTGCPCLMI